MLDTGATSLARTYTSVMEVKVMSASTRCRPQACASAMVDAVTSAAPAPPDSSTSPARRAKSRTR
jgi:hypothetical protein